MSLPSLTTAAQAREMVFRAHYVSRLIIILNLEVQPWNGEKIGNPTNLEQAQAANPPPAAPAPAANARPAPAPPGGVPKPGASKTAGKDMGPLYPIEGLSPYQNKYASRGSQKNVLMMIGGL